MNFSHHDNNDQANEQRQLDEKMVKIKHKIMVLSGKGGVGKSTVAASLAMGLAQEGYQVGLLDIDIHGPSIPKLMGLEGHQITGSDQGIVPITLFDSLKVMSIGFLIADADDAVIWRGPLKYSLIKQFLKDVDWGELDYLIVDSPPGTGDEPLSVAQLIGPGAQVVMVTTPQQLAVSDVRKCVRFCTKLNINILGVVENMSGFLCPHCQKEVAIFKQGGGKKMAMDLGLPFLGSIPIDPAVVEAGDQGQFYLTVQPNSRAAGAFRKIIQPVIDLEATKPSKEEQAMPLSKENLIKFAIPTANGVLCMHFGHCEQFTLLTADKDEKVIGTIEHVNPPMHEPGVLPKWLSGLGVKVVIAGGMGMRAQEIFVQNGIEVCTGATADKPENLVIGYLNGTLATGPNVCDH